MARSKYADFTSIGPGTSAGRFIRSFWQPVYLSRDLLNEKVVALHILGEDFTLYRSATGAAHLVAPRCAHRGLKLSTGRVEGEHIRCFYHGWAYDSSGQCVDQPAEQSSFCARVQIPSYPTREYLGMIFAYFGEGEPPEFPHLDIFDSDGFLENKASFRPWPFFTQLENSVDEVHFNFTHRRSDFTDAGYNDMIPDIDCKETEYGLMRIATRGNLVRYSHIIMPNCLYAVVFAHDRGWSEHVAWRVPVDDDSHISYIVSLMYNNEVDEKEYWKGMAKKKNAMESLEPSLDTVNRILMGELHADDLPVDRPDILFIQDAVAMIGQAGRDRNDDNLATSDKQVAMLRRIYTRELRAIEKGKPIKAWRLPADIVATRGAEISE